MSITNTANEPIDFGTLITAQPAGIEAQEKRGQSELVSGDQLPSKINSPRLSEVGLSSAAELYKKLGIKVIGQSEDDDVFLDVKLPDGWTLEAADHSMWSYLLDDKNRRRGSIFYKAAFYDRNAHFNLERRYGYEFFVPVGKDRAVVEHNSENHHYFASYITDSGIRFHQIAARFKDDLYDEHIRLCKEYLSETFPDWENPFAYWDK